ncbi:SRPBCC family protein [Microbacterium sp. LMI1-1-1.1]|uniref:SRPBCC family protein n=1 Tax=Microbacterium sp. LMI1-1-1.1 TaxID=3135223 RepID=UPI0034651823
MAARNTRLMQCTPDDVFAVLSDGWLYPVWVVGATRMRDVDPGFPWVGTQIHHSLGVWPIMLHDETEVVEWAPPQRLRLRPSASVLGRGVIRIDVRPHDVGAAVTMVEEPVSGVAARLPRQLWAPLLRLRNHECLNRLAFLAEGRAAERAAGELVQRPEVPEPVGGTPSPEALEDVRSTGL